MLAWGFAIFPSMADTNHYFDPSGSPLADYESIYPGLKEFFGDAVPDRFVVERIRANNPDYDPQTNRILLPNELKETYTQATLMSAWGALLNMTDKANLRSNFRFFSAGVQPLLCETNAACAANIQSKRRVLLMVNSYRKSGLLTFENAKDWNSFSARLASSTKNGGAAFAASTSFLHFLLDSYGKDTLLTYLGAMASNTDINAVFLASLKKDSLAVEKEWIDYLDRQPLPLPAPKVVRMLPENGATDVPVGLGEIEVEFDQPMDKWFSLVTKRNQGISYENGYWKNDHLRATKVKLLPNHEYVISINSEEYRSTANEDGVQLPITPWKFRTGPAD